MLQKEIRAMRPLLSALLLAASLAPHARGQQDAPNVPAVQEVRQLELVITGPETVPVHRGDLRRPFTATLVNRSSVPIVFVPPHSAWYGERRLEWVAVDSQGRSLDRQPNYAIECNPQGVMRAVPDLPAPILGSLPPKQIREADVVVLQPGEEYKFRGLTDPWFSLNFRRHGVYELTLRFSTASERYVLPKNSPYAAALKDSSGIAVSSNDLRLTIN